MIKNIVDIFDKISDFISWIKLLPIRKSLRQGHEYRKTILSSIDLGMFPSAQSLKIKKGYMGDYYNRTNYGQEKSKSLLNEWVEKNLTIESFRRFSNYHFASEYYSDVDINKYSKATHKIKLLAFHETDLPLSPIILFVECRIKSRFGKRFLFSTFRINESDKLSIIRDRKREKALIELL